MNESVRRIVENLNPMQTAPRDGRVVVLGNVNVGLMPMRWDSKEVHPVTGTVGVWVSPDGTTIWSEESGGPTGWRPLKLN